MIKAIRHDKIIEHTLVVKKRYSNQNCGKMQINRKAMYRQRLALHQKYLDLDNVQT